MSKTSELARLWRALRAPGGVIVGNPISGAG
jgi:hypothetical protein